MRLKHLMSAMLAGSMLVLPGSAFAAEVTAERLSAAGTEAEAGNWLMVHRTYDAQPLLAAQRDQRRQRRRA